MLLYLLAQMPAAWAHASLIRSDPADGAVVTRPPTALTLTFNEPVSPLVMRLVLPTGATLDPEVKVDNATVTITPQHFGEGTHVLSWRVISTDGHPIGGSVMFSVGAPSATPRAGQIDTDPVVKAAIWAVRLVLYLGLFVGIGGAAFTVRTAQTRPLPGRLESWLHWTMAAGLAAAVLSVGLQGLDAKAAPLRALWRSDIWIAGADGAYGITAAIAVLALVLGMLSLQSRLGRWSRTGALLALLGIGLALAASGHASSASPQSLTRSSVFFHSVLVAFWIGSLLPLVAIVRGGPKNDRSLQRFSRVIPYGLAVLAACGLYLIYVQLDRTDALWTTRYGLVMSGKLAAVATLLALAAANRYFLVPAYERASARAGPAARRRLAASIGVEFAIAVGIFGLVALWRFTPPPRALAGAETIFIHVHTEKAMTLMDVVPVRGRGADVSFLVLDGESEPLAAKEVMVSFSNPAVGIEPIRRAATGLGEGRWRIDDLRLPVSGRWHLRLDILVGDFDRAILEDDVDLPRIPQ